MFARVIAENFLQMLRIGLKGTDQLQIKFRNVREKIFELSRQLHFRQPVLSALLGRFDRDLLPLRLFLRRVFCIKIDNRALGNERTNFGRADLDRFLHDQVHVFSFRNRLAERDPATQRRRLRFVQFAQTNFIARKIDNLRCNLAPLVR